jgi:hypothetical protein
MPESTRRIFVITNAKGDVVGSSYVPASQYSSDAPSPGRPIPLRGQRVHEIDLPAELRQIESAADFHKHLKTLLTKQRRSAKPRAAAKKARGR